jgi:SET domain-containing protein
MHKMVPRTPAKTTKPPAAKKSARARKSAVVPVIDPRHACFRLEVRPSKIHRWGVYALEDIPVRRKVMEYTGERISRKETKRRSDEQDHMIYLFTLDNYWTLDGSVGGSGAEYINHSCDPNIVTEIRQGHILYMSRRPIRRGQELTVDYHFGKDIEEVPCSCGAAVCRGTINLK